MAKSYIVSRKIASGGMAEVLLAARTGAGGFEKLVVLKRILSHLKEDGQFLQMFLNEARLAALLKHPNIVEIYDVERTGGDFVVVMEYLSGEDLRYMIGHMRQERQPMDVGIACRIISDAAAALHFAHTATDMDGKPMSVVHRDVAPGNILVTYDGVTKLLDFGIAKATTRATYTVPGTMKGKFAYMSPEHIQQLPLDGRSDIFSLGVVFWELLAAQRLFKGTNDAAVLKQVMEKEIPPPSELRPELPPKLDEIVMKCLERDYNERTPTARALREQLEDLLIEMGRYVTASQVAEWMKNTLPWRYHQRKEMERTVVKDTRNGGKSSDDETAQGRASSPDVSEQNTASIITTGLPEGRSKTAPPIFGAQRQTPGGSVTGLPAVGTGGNRIGLPTGPYPATGTPSVISPYVMPEPPRRNPLVIIAISALVTLLLVGLAAGFYVLGRKLTTQTATLVVHAVPEGSHLSVNGKIRARDVGADGTSVPVEARKRLKLRVSKPGRVSQETTIVAPGSGSRHVYFTLPKLRQ